MEALLETQKHWENRQFHLAVRRVADSLNYGTDASPFVGSGIDFVQSRPYQAGDPIKSIDWRVTGRTGRVFVKEYEAPKRMPVYVLVDTSASMCVSSTRLSKYAWAVPLAGGLALAALERMSPVGIIGCGDRPLGTHSTLSRAQLFLWLDLLRRHRFDEETRLGSRLAELAGILEDRSLVIVLSDLHDPAALPGLKLMAQRHDCVVLQLQDPAERGLNGAGIYRGLEAETGRSFVARGRRDWLDHAGMEAELRRAGIDSLLLPTDTELLPKVRLFLRRRDQVGKGGR